MDIKNNNDLKAISAVFDFEADTLTVKCLSDSNDLSRTKTYRLPLKRFSDFSLKALEENIQEVMLVGNKVS